MPRGRRQALCSNNRPFCYFLSPSVCLSFLRRGFINFWTYFFTIIGLFPKLNELLDQGRIHFGNLKKIKETCCQFYDAFIFLSRDLIRMKNTLLTTNERFHNLNKEVREIKRFLKRQYLQGDDVGTGRRGSEDERETGGRRRGNGEFTCQSPDSTHRGLEGREKADWERKRSSRKRRGNDATNDDSCATTTTAAATAAPSRLRASDGSIDRID